MNRMPIDTGAEECSARPALEDSAYMRRACGLAASGWGRVSPNPLVGAVITDERGIAGEGHHPEFGREHAERVALRQARERARGATLYVTLEPCAHHGKTEPCVEAILDAGLGRVVIGCEDPNPVAGGGARLLRSAGVAVQTGVEALAAARTNAHFLHYHRTGRPFVTLKLALSLDARIAARAGVRTRISGAEASAWTHRLRAGHDAILVGRVTAEVDDPLLTARGPLPRVPPLRIVLDPGLRLETGSRLVESVREAPVWVATAPGADPRRRARLERCGVRVVPLPASRRHRLALDTLLSTLAESGVTSLLVEGGGTVAVSFLKQDLVQRLHLIRAPRVLGPAGVPAFPGRRDWPGPQWQATERMELGPDVLDTFEPPGLASALAGIG